MSNVARSSAAYYDAETPIFTDFSLYKIAKDKIIAHNDGSLSLVIKFTGLNSTSFTEDKYEDIYRVIQNIVEQTSSNGSGVTFQFVHTHFKNMKKVETDHLPSFLRYRAEYFNELSESNIIFQDDYYISILISPLKQTTKSALKGFIDSIMNKDKENDVRRRDNAFADASFRSKVIEGVVKNIAGALKDIGFIIHELSSNKEYYDLFQKFTRPKKSNMETIEVNQSQGNNTAPRIQLFSGVRMKSKMDHFILDDTFHRVYTMDSVPQDAVNGETFKNMAQVGREFIFSLSTRAMDETEVKKFFEWQRVEKKINASSATSLGGGSDPFEDAKLQKIEQAQHDMAYQGARGVKSSANLIVRVDQAQIEKEMRINNFGFGEWLRDLDNRLMHSIFPALGRSQWSVDHNTGWFVFNKCIPGFGDLTSLVLKPMTIMAENFPYLMNLWSYRGRIPHNGVNHWFLPDGGFTTHATMDSSLQAWNYNLSGDPGSGKSVFAITMMAMAHAESVNNKPPKICVIDNSGDRGTYYKYGELVGATRINLAKLKKPTIQLFDINPEESLPTEKKAQALTKLFKSKGIKLSEQEIIRVLINGYFPEMISKGIEATPEFQKNLVKELFQLDAEQDVLSELILKKGDCRPNQKDSLLILSVLEIMLSDNPELVDGFRLHKASDISEILIESYNRTEGRLPYMSDYLKTARELMMDEETKEISDEGQEILTKIKNWTVQGNYSMFDGDTDVDLDANTIIVDMKDIDSDPSLKMIYTLMFQNLFSRAMYNIRGRIKLLVLDEAWALMRTESARKFMEMNARTSRKSGFACLNISQYPTDYNNPDPKIGEKIIASTNVFLIGRIGDRKIIDEIKYSIGLPEKIASQLQNMGNKKDVNGNTMYSQFVWYAPQVGVQVIRNILHPFEYMLYSSTEGDNLIIDYYRKVVKQFDGIEECVQFISEGKHFGDEGLIKFLKTSGQAELAGKIEKKR